MIKIARTLLALLTAAVLLAGLLGPVGLGGLRAASRNLKAPQAASLKATKSVTIGSQGKWLTLPLVTSGTYADDQGYNYYWQFGFSTDPAVNPLVEEQSELVSFSIDDTDTIYAWFGLRKDDDSVDDWTVQIAMTYYNPDGTVVDSTWQTKGGQLGSLAGGGMFAPAAQATRTPRPSSTPRATRTPTVAPTNTKRPTKAPRTPTPRTSPTEAPSDDVSDLVVDTTEYIEGDNVAVKKLDIAALRQDENKLLIPGSWALGVTLFDGNSSEGSDLTFQPFSMTNTSTDNNDALAQEVTDQLAAAGYNVRWAGQSEYTDTHEKYAYAFMDMVNPDLYSADSSDELFSGFLVVSTVYSDTDFLESGLVTQEDDYLISAQVERGDWDDFIAKYRDATGNADAQGQAWLDFTNTIGWAVYDLNNAQWLSSEEISPFLSDKFGGGAVWNAPTRDAPPINGPTGKVAAIKLSANTTTIKPDGKSTATITAKLLNKKNEPVADEPVQFSLSTGAPGTLRPSNGAAATDADGVATITFRAAKKEGTAVITAAAAGVQATISIFVSEQDQPTNDPAANVTAFLEQQGYDVTSVGFLSDADGNPTTTDAAVVMPRASEKIDSVLGTQLLNGWSSLHDNYPDATTYWVITTFDHFAVYWPVPKDTITTYLGKIDDNSLTDDEVSTFWGDRLDSIVVVDTDTGEVVSNSKDFLDKNFGRPSN